jgi:hypothetical protein
MTRSEHAREAERLLERAQAQFEASQQSFHQARVTRDEAHWYLKKAQVHATLATADVEPEAAPVAAKTERPKPRPPVVF